MHSGKDGTESRMMCLGNFWALRDSQGMHEVGSTGLCEWHWVKRVLARWRQQ